MFRSYWEVCCCFKKVLSWMRQGLLYFFVLISSLCSTDCIMVPCWYSHIFYYTLHDHFFSGVSLLVQDSEIAESQGIASPKQDDTPARVSDHLQAPQDARRRASTGSSPISEAGSTGTLDSVGQLGFSQQSVQSNGMHSYFFNVKKCYKMWKLSS